jgi:hypothetical protein
MPEDHEAVEEGQQLTQQEILERIAGGDVPSQPFHHHDKRAGYRWTNAYRFADGTKIMAHEVSRLRVAGMIQLVVVGNRRKVVLCENGT